MKKNWTLAVIALVASIAAVAFAFLAGKQWNEELEPEPDPDEVELKVDHDGEE